MKSKSILITNDANEIPALFWGDSGNKLIIAIHGDLSNKKDTVIELLAKNAINKDYCILSFDLPEHGERKNDKTYECNPWNCIADFQAVYNYAKSISNKIYLFACSIGAYFSLLAFHKLDIQKTFFLSPIVNMEKVIQSMMTAFSVSEQRLKEERRISLPIDKTLDWDYYSYVKQHPIDFRWNSPIALLCGSKDIVSSKEEINKFSLMYKAKLTVLENGEHYFSSQEELRFFEMWLNENL